MSAPTEKHRKALNCLEELANMPLGISLEDWSRLSAPILEALTASEDQYKRGLERAAEIVGEFDDEDILLGKDVAEIARNSILSEITPSPAASSQRATAGSGDHPLLDPAPIHDEASK